MYFKSCIFPKKVNYYFNKETKKNVLNWKEFDPSKPYYILPCNKCLYCQNKYSNSWAVRCMLEAKDTTENCFLTLTYNDENLPLNGELKKRDLQLFMKSLRAKISPTKIRFFACGEYGAKKSRPHYHVIIFGWKPKDLTKWKSDHNGIHLYLSRTIDKLWKRGFISVGTTLNTKTIKYTAKYLTKFQKRDFQKTPAFTVMSNRPGIGAKQWNLKMYKDNGIYLDGKKYSIPRYFDKLSIEKYGLDISENKRLRQEKAKQHELDPYQQNTLQYHYFDYMKRNRIPKTHLYNFTEWKSNTYKSEAFRKIDQTIADHRDKNILEYMEKQVKLRQEKNSTIKISKKGGPNGKNKK